MLIIIHYDNQILNSISPCKKYIKNIFLENRPVKCFIDFGSECSLINQSSISSFGLKPEPLKETTYIHTLSDTTLIVSYYVHGNVNIDSIEKRIKFYVINKQILNVDILIGQNFTELNDITYFKSGSTLQFSTIGKGLVLDKSNVNIGIDDPVAERSILNLLNQFKKIFCN